MVEDPWGAWANMGWKVPSIPMCQQVSMPIHSAPDAEWMTEAGKLMLRIGKEPLLREEFSPRIADRGEIDVGVVEMKCFEDCTLPPRPDNGVIVAVDNINEISDEEGRND
jgi:hypothetical protein